MDREKKRQQIDAYKAILFAAGLVGMAALIYSLREVFASITIAVFFFYLLDPVACRLTGRKIGKKATISRLVASIIAFIVGLAVLTLFLLMLIPAIADQVQRVSDNMPAYTQQAEETLDMLQQKYHRLELPPSVQQSVNKSIDRLTVGSTALLHNAASGVVHFFSQIVLLLMIPFLVFYMLIEKQSVKNAIIGVFPKKYQEEAAQFLTESSHALRGFIIGQLILCIITAIAMSLGLWLLGVKAPLFLGLIAGATAMIPIVGIMIGCIPAAFVALSTSTTLALWVILIFTAVQLLKNKVILPLFFSLYVNLSPLTILLVLMVGEQLGGILGMFVATPLAAVIHVLYTHLRKRYE